MKQVPFPRKSDEPHSSDKNVQPGEAIQVSNVRAVPRAARRYGLLPAQAGRLLWYLTR